MPGCNADGRRASVPTVKYPTNAVHFFIAAPIEIWVNFTYLRRQGQNGNAQIVEAKSVKTCPFGRRVRVIPDCRQAGASSVFYPCS